MPDCRIRVELGQPRRPGGTSGQLGRGGGTPGRVSLSDMGEE
jgi:hypothetical protein